MKLSKALITILVIILSASAAANVYLPAVIADNMVLQQQMLVPIWGFAEPGELVTVSASWSFFSKTSTKAGTDGQWMLRIETPKASNKKHTLTVAGKNTIKLENILIGEVWVCSGQSNMIFRLPPDPKWNLKGVFNYKSEIETANYPNIRYFTVEAKAAEKPQDDCTGSWSLCSPKTVVRFSATAYFFAQKIHEETGFPIGLIHAAWGGTPAEAWTGKEAFNNDQSLKKIITDYENHLKNFPEALKKYQDDHKKWQQLSAKAKADGTKIPAEPVKPIKTNQYHPSSLYNGMIAPIIPYGIKGAIWYQGESNTYRAYQYRTLFPTMIINWRTNWSQGDFPFYFTQIAPFNYPGKNIGPELQEAQLMTLSLRNTGMAVTTDIGNNSDIHPRNKQMVGRRLALWALARNYGQEDLVHSGPLYKDMQIEGDKIRIVFDHVGSGLFALSGNLKNFTIAGHDKNFVEANAIIDNNTVVVSSPDIKKPAAVRYAWTNTAIGNLYNFEMLPASPFRTED